MDILFTPEEMAESCYETTKKSKKKPLPQEKISLIEGKIIKFSHVTVYNILL